MVQMVVNCDHLAPAYQGQSLEIMRLLRDHYEIKRIQDMESDELVEIKLKEDLFSTFCRLLNEFDLQYTPEEKLNPMGMQLENIPGCFKHHQSKFDYQPAINALKESWALWLTLHVDHINRHDDFHQLKEDLIKTITGTSEKLMRGESDNFYDHVRQAIVRTDLHCRNKSSNSNGADTYWKKVENFDKHYKAVSLYNQAYITINLRKGKYKEDARNLLEEAKKSINVYISEVSNTMVSCNLSITGNKDQSAGNNNFQSQMEARMNIFKSWMTYIDIAVRKLEELEKSNSGAITEDCSVYMLSEEKNFIISNELKSLYDYGLGVVFEVKKKPNGTKSFSAVASEFIKSGTAAFTSFKGSVQYVFNPSSQSLFKTAIKNMTTSGALKDSFKYATKYVVKEISKKSVISVINYGINRTVEEAFKQILDQSFKNIVASSLKQNNELDQTLIDFISSGVPKAALKKENFKIDSKYEKQIKNSFDMLCEEVIPQLVLDCTKTRDVITNLSKVCDIVINEVKQSGLLTAAKVALKAAEFSTRLTEILSAIPTKNIIDQKFVPPLLEGINELLKEMTKQDQDGRHDLDDVKRLKRELLHEIAQNVSEQFISSCSEHIRSILITGFKSQFNSATSQVLDKVMSRNKTQRFFEDQRERYNNKSASHKEVQQLSEENKTKLKQYTEDLCKDDQPTTSLDVYVLTKSNLLNGKGICLTIVDQKGKQLTVERQMGTNKSAGEIKLRLTKSVKVQHSLQDGSQLYSGHFDIVQDDGKIIKVNSDDQNALYYAVVQANGSKTEDPKKEALMLREKVKNEIQTNLELYTPQLILQRENDISHRNLKKYSLSEGSKKEANTPLLEYFQSVKFIKSDERILIKVYHLGFVGEYKR
ncbi:hypothetical protein E1301_Tti015514 [Triplophysa tibetana]|uniref:Uncharacterized protein n=1 Tax=Triplophysa tibetana TaxID=1572043 RepID=A0A5A9N1S0_9TELE|nr:hypothetical protein E1301_Tti015514 [Triplophysa tibetana]